MNEILVLASLLFALAVGFFTIYLLGFLREFSILENLPFSFGLGVGLIAFQMFLYSLFNLKWDVKIIFLPWLMAFAFLIIKNPKIMKPNKFLYFKWANFNKIILFFILLLLIFVGIEALIRPLSAWDGWASWLLKAKMFFIDGEVRSDVFRYLDSEYPLVISLFSAFSYVLLGEIDDKAILLVFFTFYLMLSLAFFAAIKRYINDTWALLLTFLLMSLQNLIRHGGRFEAGQADLALGFYIFLTTVLLLNHLKNKSYKTMVLLSIFLGITANVKNEGIPFAVIILTLVCYTAVKVKKHRHLLITFLGIAPIIGWQVFKYVNNLPKLPAFVGWNLHFERIPVVLFEISKEFVNIKNWNMLWLLFFVALAVYLCRKKWDVKINTLYVIIFIQLLVYVLIFLATPIDPAIHIKNVIDRLLIHLAALSLFVTSLVIINNKNFKKI